MAGLPNSSSPSWALLASSAVSRLFSSSAQGRGAARRSPAGDTASPRFLNSSGRPAEGRLLNGECNNSLLDLLRHAFFSAGLLRLISYSASSPPLSYSSKAVAAVAHHVAGLTHVSELLGQLQSPTLARMIFCSVVVVSSNRRGGALRHPTAPRPASACDSPWGLGNPVVSVHSAGAAIISWHQTSMPRVLTRRRKRRLSVVMNRVEPSSPQPRFVVIDPIGMVPRCAPSAARTNTAS